MPCATSRIPIHFLALSKFRLGYMGRYRIPASSLAPATLTSVHSTGALQSLVLYSTHFIKYNTPSFSRRARLRAS